MRMQLDQGAQRMENSYQQLKQEVMGRKKALDDSVNDYKMGILKSKE
jgi:hypothetical protein